MNKMTLEEAASSFSGKYKPKLSDIFTIGVNTVDETILVYTTNAKIWVDLPEFHEGFYVKMVVTGRPVPAGGDL